MKSVKCPHCGLVAFASALTCKRCGQSLETSAQSQLERDELEPLLEKEIESTKRLVYTVGFLGTGALSIVAAVISESPVTIVILFGGILTTGILWTWALANRAEARLLAGRKPLVYKITPAQRASVATASIAAAAPIAINSDYGFILAPLIIVICNGGLFLYEREMRSKRAVDDARG
jgi:hypothetical protein